MTSSSSLHVIDDRFFFPLVDSGSIVLSSCESNYACLSSFPEDTINSTHFTLQPDTSEFTITLDSGGLTVSAFQIPEDTFFINNNRTTPNQTVSTPGMIFGDSSKIEAEIAYLSEDLIWVENGCKSADFVDLSVSLVAGPEIMLI